VPCKLLGNANFAVTHSVGDDAHCIAAAAVGWYADWFCHADGAKLAAMRGVRAPITLIVKHGLRRNIADAGAVSQGFDADTWLLARLWRHWRGSRPVEQRIAATDLRLSMC